MQEPKTIEQILDQVAVQMGYKSIDDFYSSLSKYGQVHRIITKTMQSYAHQQCELQKVKCAEYAETDLLLIGDMDTYNYVISAPNVCDNP